MNAERTFVDTNVLVYTVDDGEPAKQRQAQQLLRELPSDDLVISTQVLIEFYAVATRKLSLSESDASALVDRWAKLDVVVTDAGLVREAVATSRASVISIFDALIVEAARVGGCARVLTEDLASGATLKGVRIDNPFT